MPSSSSWKGMNLDYIEQKKTYQAGGLSKRKLIFQPQCFMCYVSFRHGISVFPHVGPGHTIQVTCLLTVSCSVERTLPETKIAPWMGPYSKRKVSSPKHQFTLQEINISHLGKRKIIFKMDFSGDMLVPRRVFSGALLSFTEGMNSIFESVVSFFWFPFNHQR